MPEPDDQQLLGEFASANSEAAFAGLVARHINLEDFHPYLKGRSNFCRRAPGLLPVFD